MTPTVAARPTFPARLAIAAIYVAFAALVFVLHGKQPPLGIDHIAYFKLADDITRLHPDGAYWRSISSVQTYGVILAYVRPLTGDHIVSLKWILAVITFFYLLCAESFWASFTSRRILAVAISLISALYVSFGASFWGMTDFAASLNRSLIIPPILLLLGWYFRRRNSSRRFLVYPILIYLSLLHLSTYHLLALLMAVDGTRLLYGIVRLSSWREVRAFAGALVLMVCAYGSLSAAHLDSTSLATLVPRVTTAPALAATAGPDLPVPTKPVPASSSDRPPLNLVEALKASAWDQAVDSKMAWKLEIEAQPWRNFPPPAATLLGVLGSAFFLIVTSVACGRFAIRRGGPNDMDRVMLLFAAWVFLGSYGLQTTLWLLRQFLPIYPMNFEEVRILSFLMIPLMYFALRGLDTLCAHGSFQSPQAQGWLVAAAICGLLLQPVYLIRVLPTKAREFIFESVQSAGWLDRYPSQRNAFAQEYLRIARTSDRLYYPIQPVLQWLQTHAATTDRVLTNRDDLYILPARVIGTSNGFLNTSSASLQRAGWSVVKAKLGEAIRQRDLAAIVCLGQECSARFAVVPWSVPNAAFEAEGFSIVELLPPPTAAATAATGVPR